MNNQYETVVGLEVHSELKTKTKIFCSCENRFGAEPNSCCCPVCMGLPGALPSLNKSVVDYAILAGLSLNCEISNYTRTDRKNYFYPDLPKGYQISQFKYPLCKNGYIEIQNRKIGITRIHIEEDAGKLIHENGETLTDFNRCGVPLIEIVSEPDIRSADEAIEYLKNLRSVLMCTGVSDCRMNEGAFRCDINISVRKHGEKLGTRCEIKNLNSFKFVKRAIEYETARQIEILENGGEIVCSTMRYENGKTIPMRTKETSDDYRYFPEPDIPAFFVSNETVEKIRKKIPELPKEKKERYVKQYGVTEYDAKMLVADKNISDYFEETAKHTKYPKKAANLIITECFGMGDVSELVIPFSPKSLGDTASLFGNGVINSGIAKKIISELWKNDFDVPAYVNENNLAQLSDEGIIGEFVSEAIAENQKIIGDYKKGKPSAANSLVGRVMGKTRGRGNPEIVIKLVNQALEKIKD